MTIKQGTSYLDRPPHETTEATRRFEEELLLRRGQAFYRAKNCRHVKPRIVEDVLREFAYKVCDLNVADEAIAKYAAELRMRDAE